MKEQPSLKSVLITGGAGFIGSHTAELLLENKIAVTIYDNFSSGKLTNLPQSSPLLRVVEADVLDYPTLAAEVAKVDAVLHLAAIVSVPKSIEDPWFSYQVNSNGFVQLLQALKEAGKPIRLVYASSSAIYGDTELLPCPDDQRLATTVLSPYALHKVQMEQYAELYTKLYQQESLGLRYFNAYGSRQDASSPYSGVISRFINLYLQGQALTIYGDGEQLRDYIHVSEIARANVLALQSSYSGVLNVATGKPETLKQLVQYLEEKGGRKAQCTYVAPRLGDIRASFAKTERAKQILGFQSMLSLKEGISGLLEEQVKLKSEYEV